MIPTYTAIGTGINNFAICGVFLLGLQLFVDPNSSYASPESGPGQVTLTLKSSLVFRHDPLLLADVADCVGDAALCAEAGELDLGVRAFPGKTQVLTAARLREYLGKEWPDATLVFKGSEQVKLSSPSRQLPVEEIEQALVGKLDETFGQSKDIRVSLERIQMTALITVLDEEHTLEFPLLDGSKDWSKDWDEWALLRTISSAITLQGQYKSQRGIQNFYFQPGFRIEEFVLVATAPIQAGSPLKATQAERQWRVRVAGRHQDDAVHAIGQMAGLVSKHSISAGSVILKNAFTPPVIVKRGQVLTLSSSDAGISVSLKVSALSSAAAGQEVEVETLGGRRRLHARVTGPSTAEVVRW